MVVVATPAVRVVAARWRECGRWWQRQHIPCRGYRGIRGGGGGKGKLMVVAGVAAASGLRGGKGEG
jgi:hypothetical protein